MNNKTLTAILLLIIIFTGITGIYIMYDKTHGKSIEGAKSYLETMQKRELAQAVAEISIDQESEINQIKELLDEGSRVCVTLANTNSFSIQQKYVKYDTQIENIRNMIQEDSKTTTWKIIDVSEVPCKPIATIIEIEN